ncbi:MAG TPA: flagellar basal body L-ring protein FlgH [Acidisarcina sp.]
MNTRLTHIGTGERSALDAPDWRHSPRTRLRGSFVPAAAAFALLLIAASPSAGAKSLLSKAPVRTPQQLRTDYIQRLQQLNVPSDESHTMGSLWSPSSALSDLSTDYKAHQVNDTITIQISVQTTAAQSGTVNSQRTFSTDSSISGLGYSPVSTNPLINAKSASTLKGQGATSTATTFSTSLTGQVIAMLPNGNMVVEAERQIYMNNQHENVIVRGVVRPGDITPANTVPSTALSNLEIEMKGKGIISDSVRPPNFLTRAVLWLFGF